MHLLKTARNGATLSLVAGRQQKETIPQPQGIHPLLEELGLSYSALMA